MRQRRPGGNGRGYTARRGRDHKFREISHHWWRRAGVALGLASRARFGFYLSVYLLWILLIFFATRGTNGPGQSWLAGWQLNGMRTGTNKSGARGIPPKIRKNSGISPRVSGYCWNHLEAFSCVIFCHGRCFEPGGFLLHSSVGI